MREGDWKLGTKDGGVRAAAVSVGQAARVGAERPAAAVTRARASSAPPSLAAVLAALLGAGRIPRRRRTQTQQFFEQRLLADKQTSKAIKELLRSGGGFVDTGVVFRDLTGDKRDDAVVRVNSGGAAGVVAVYVFSTANRKDGKLRAIFRSQSLMRASTRVLKGVVSYRTSRYEPGDELCCPARITQSTLELERRRAPHAGGRARDLRAAARGPGARARRPRTSSSRGVIASGALAAARASRVSSRAAADALGGQQPVQVVDAAHGHAVDRDDEVLGAQARRRRPARPAMTSTTSTPRVAARRGGDARRQRARAAGDADPGAADAAVAHQRGDRSPRVVALIGTARPSPTPATAVLMPTTRPRPSTSAPPELPGLSAASVWMTSSTIRVVCARAGRQRAAERGDDAGGHRAGEAVRVADRDDELADAQRGGVAELGRARAPRRRRAARRGRTAGRRRPRAPRPRGRR